MGRTPRSPGPGPSSIAARRRRTPPLPTQSMPYVGPEVTAPVLSALAGLMGLLLFFWRQLTGWIRRTFRRIFRRDG